MLFCQPLCLFPPYKSVYFHQVLALAYMMRCLNKLKKFSFCSRLMCRFHSPSLPRSVSCVNIVFSLVFLFCVCDFCHSLSMTISNFVSVSLFSICLHFFSLSSLSLCVFVSICIPPSLLTFFSHFCSLFLIVCIPSCLPFWLWTFFSVSLSLSEVFFCASVFSSLWEIFLSHPVNVVTWGCPPIDSPGSMYWMKVN